MNIIAHRGHWLKSSEQNTESAFRRALSGNFGIETDLRDHCGEIVISHDMARDDAMQFDKFLEIYRSYDTQPMLALNIKADGLHKRLAASLLRFKIRNYFFFDMSIPDSLGYFYDKLNVFTRRSEFETGSRLDDRAMGFWLDSFELEFVEPSSIYQAITEGHSVAVVSPELHRKAHEGAWAAWRAVHLDLPKSMRAQFMLCTDLPNEAEHFFLNAE